MDFFELIGTFKQSLTIINAPHEVVDQPYAPDINVTKGAIEFKNVTFHYNDDESLFNNKNIIIKPGEKVGLVGFSGSGKTTFINLILRFYDIESGTITIDGQDISTISQESLRRNIAMIPQDTSLFHRSIMDNIRYGLLDASDEEVRMAAKHAHADEFIEKLPKGFDTIIGERGQMLSGGQQQRIAIARTVIRNPDIIIFDEATNALDKKTENKIMKNIQKYAKNKIIILVSHNTAILKYCNKHYIIKNKTNCFCLIKTFLFLFDKQNTVKLFC